MGFEAGLAQIRWACLGMFISIFCGMALVCLLCGGVMAANVHRIFGDALTASECTTAKTLFLILVVNMALTFPNSVFNCYITAHEHFLFQINSTQFSDS